MIAYNREWLYNLHVQNEADIALDEECISADAHKAIYEEHKVGFYTPNFFIKIGIALLSVIGLSSSGGFLFMLFNISTSFPAYMVFMGVVCIVVVELFIRYRHLYNAGLDNMLVWIGSALIISGIIVSDLLHGGHSYGGYQSAYTTECFVAFIICLAAAIRYADILMSIAATVSLLMFLLFGYRHMGSVAIYTEPFAIIMFSIILYAVIRWLMKVPGAILYQRCLKSSMVVALVAIYAAGNNYTVGEYSISIFNTRAHSPVSLSWFFWAWTFILPLVYIAIGIRKKEVTFIHLGIPLIAVSVFTFRYYHHVLPPEIAMMLGGGILILACYLLIRYLGTPKGGFTFAAKRTRTTSPELHQLLTNEVINKAKQGHT